MILAGGTFLASLCHTDRFLKTFLRESLSVPARAKAETLRYVDSELDIKLEKTLLTLKTEILRDLSGYLDRSPGRRSCSSSGSTTMGMGVKGVGGQQ